MFWVAVKLAKDRGGLDGLRIFWFTLVMILGEVGVRGLPLGGRVQVGPLLRQSYEG